MSNFYIVEKRGVDNNYIDDIKKFWMKLFVWVLVYYTYGDMVTFKSKYKIVIWSIRIINIGKRDRFREGDNSENVINSLSKLFASVNMKKSFKKLVR